MKRLRENLASRFWLHFQEPHRLRLHRIEFAQPVERQPAGRRCYLNRLALACTQMRQQGPKTVHIEIPWIIQSVLVGPQGVEGGAGGDQAVRSLVLAGEAIDLEAEDQADVAEGDLPEQPGEILAAGRGGGGAALITVKYANPFTGPAPGQGAVL